MWKTCVHAHDIGGIAASLAPTIKMPLRALAGASAQSHGELAAEAGASSWKAALRAWQFMGSECALAGASAQSLGEFAASATIQKHIIK